MNKVGFRTYHTSISKVARQIHNSCIYKQEQSCGYMSLRYRVWGVNLLHNHTYIKCYYIEVKILCRSHQENEKIMTKSCESIQNSSQTGITIVAITNFSG